MPRAFLTARCKSQDFHDSSDDDEGDAQPQPDTGSGEQQVSFADLPPDVTDGADTGYNTRAAKRRKRHRQLQEQKQMKNEEQANQEVESVNPVKPPAPIERWINDADGKQRRIYECAVCGKVFLAMYTLQRHLPTHTGERKFECTMCGKRFSQASTLSRHKAIHSNIRPFLCQICNKAFNRQSTLISHTKLHSELRPHTCHICNKSFHQKGNLKTHMNIHMDTRPYKCKHCDRGFNQQSNLAFHIAQAHTDRNQISCHLCGDRFRKKHDLRKHELKVHGVSNKEELEAWQRKKASGALCQQSNTSNTITLPNGDKTIRFDMKRLGVAKTPEELNHSQNDHIIKASASTQQMEKEQQKSSPHLNMSNLSPLLIVDPGRKSCGSPCNQSSALNASSPTITSGTVNTLIGKLPLCAISKSQNRLAEQLKNAASEQTSPLPPTESSQQSDTPSKKTLNDITVPDGTTLASNLSQYKSCVQDDADTRRNSSTDSEEAHFPQIGRQIATFVKVQTNPSKVLDNNFILDSSQIKTMGTDSDGHMIAMISQGVGGTPLLVKMLPLSVSFFSQSGAKNSRSGIEKSNGCHGKCGTKNAGKDDSEETSVDSENIQ